MAFRRKDRIEEEHQKGPVAMNSRTGRATAGRHRRHHPYDSAPLNRPAPSRDMTAQAIIAAMSAAVIAGALWSLLQTHLAG